MKFPENNPDYYIIAGKLRDAAGDLTRESLRKELNSGLNDGKRPAFDPWSFVSSLSSPFPWKRKAKTLEMGNPGRLQVSQSLIKKLTDRVSSRCSASYPI